MDEYIEEEILGHGMFGTVWLVKSISSPNYYALKDINMSAMDYNEQQRAMTEVTVLSKCRHENIIAYKDSKVDELNGNLYILMEFAESGNLLTAIQYQQGVPFPECTVISWFIEISQAIQYLHHNNLLHRDLKCENIFLSKYNVIKVGDFGLAKILNNSGEFALTVTESAFYPSPEICKQQPYNFKSDIWALGCILFEMSALEIPFEAATYEQLKSEILRGKRSDLPEWSGLVVRELVNDLLRLNPIRRPSADEILSKPSLEPYFMFTGTKNPFLNFQPVSPNSHLLKKAKSPSRVAKIPNHLGLKKDNQRQGASTTYAVPKNPQIYGEPSSKVDFHRQRSELMCRAPVKQKPRSSMRLPVEKREQIGLQVRVGINVNNEVRFSSATRISTFSSPHSQYHQCMVDALWKNRIKHCQRTSMNDEIYSQLQSKLMSVFKRDKFLEIYRALWNDWNDIEDTKISCKSYTKSLTSEEMQYLPLLIKLVQLDMLKVSLEKEP